MNQVLMLKKNIDTLIASLAGFIIIFFFTRHGGIGVCPDGVAYISTAENFSATGKLIDFTKNQLIDFPLFYPVFLSLLSLLTGLKTLSFMPIVNALLFSFLIYLSGYIIQQFNYKSKWYKLTMLSCIVLSPCLLEVYSMVWSETLFLIWLLLFMIAMHAYFKSYSVKFLIIAATIASIASVTRYAGIAIIGTGGLLLLIDLRLPVKEKIRHVVIFSIISSSLLLLNLVRNFIVSGTLTGFRERSIRSLFQNAAEIGSVLFNWLPFSISNINGAFVVFLTLALLLIACVYLFLKNKRFATYQQFACLFALLFLSFMLATASSSRFEDMNSRLLSPLFIPLLYCGSVWIIFIWRKAKNVQKNWVIGLGLAIFSFFQYGQLKSDYETWDGVKDAGIPGYTEDQWKYSQTVQYIEKDSLPFKENYTVYSNAYDAIHFFTGKPGKFLPHKEFLKDKNSFLNDPHCYVVWFDDGINDDLVSLSFIIEQKRMRLVRQFNDGAIYEFND